MKNLLLIIALGSLLTSCKVQQSTPIKIQASDRNYFVDAITYKGNDSIQITERKRNGQLKPTVTLAVNQVKIIERN